MSYKEKVKEMYSKILNAKSKHGQVNGRVLALIGALIVVVIATSLGPTFFANTNITGAPSWLATVLPVIIASGLIFIIWRAFSG